MRQVATRPPCVGWSRGVGKQVFSDTAGSATRRTIASTPEHATFYVSVTEFSAVWAYTPDMGGLGIIQASSCYLLVTRLSCSVSPFLTRFSVSPCPIVSQFLGLLSHTSRSHPSAVSQFLTPGDRMHNVATSSTCAPSLPRSAPASRRRERAEGGVTRGMNNGREQPFSSVICLASGGVRLWLVPWPYSRS